MENFLLDDKLLDSIIQKVKKKKYSKLQVLSAQSVIKNDNELKCFLFYYQHKPNKCEKCNLSGLWQGKVLELLVYRKNKLKLDNRLDNIKLLCPNCFSQKNDKGIYIHVKNSKMANCIDCDRRFRKRVSKETINPTCDIVDTDLSKHKYVKKRCDICVQLQIQKKDYTKLNEIQVINKKKKEELEVKII